MIGAGSNDQPRPKIKIDMIMVNRQLSNLKQRLIEKASNGESFKPPRIPRKNMPLNREKVHLRYYLFDIKAWL